ncbi:Yip1 family protein [Chloroflexus sp.]|uniref:Yip1 family protein n=1 Tax=Chloroflexus sp. TaxID=1904827 RepID=UPI00298ED74A|nr:Yip1 family protein [Chloroflexus sp.]MDW8403230.1 Yip1 family protein [Chloroflexus sp.]
MIQEMVNGSIAVLTKPSAQTFEQHERDNLVWALIYAVIASVINGILSVITWPLEAGSVRAQLEAQGLPPDVIETTLAQQGNIIGLVLGGIFGTIIGSLVVWGLIYLLGRAFGGTGSFGELAWGISLFSSPLAVAQTIANAIPSIGGLISLALTLYGVYLTYLAIQSGMNLPSKKALYIAIILAVIGIIFVCFTAGLLAAALLILSGGFAP